MPIFRGKNFVSSASDYKDSVRVSTRSNVNISASMFTIDGITLIDKDRVLLVGQTTQTQNGIYSWSSATNKLTRSNDADSIFELSAGNKVYVEEGNTFEKTTWTLITSGVITPGITGLTFAKESRLGTSDISGTYGGPTKTLEIIVDETGQINSISEHIINVLPSQTGNSGKYLKTNGSSSSWETISTTLSGLTDVNVADASNNYFLTYDSTTSTWIAEQGIADGTLIDGGNLDGQSSGSGITNISDVHNLSDLTDILISNLTANQVLKFNGTNWINDTLSSNGGGTSSYDDLTNKPTLFSGSYTDLTNKPTLFSGSYTDLTNKPTLFDGVYASLSDKPTLFSGSYTDLTNKPTIPAAQVQTDWNESAGLGVILNKPTLSTVATSGSYTDLTNKPTIPTVPTTVSSFTNDAGYLTSVTNITGNAATVTNGVYTNGSYSNPAWITSLDYGKLTGAPTLSTVATSGSYNDLTNKPSSAYSNQYVVTGTTTNGTETEIFVNGVNNSRISVPLNTAVYYTLDIVCRRTDVSGNFAAFYIKGMASNIEGTTSDIGSIYEVVIARTDASFLVDVRADNTNDTINVYVTGATGKTLSWKCSVTTTEV